MAVDLIGTRGRRFLRAIPLLHPASGTPLSTVEAQSLRDTYPILQMQVRQLATDTGPPLIDLTAAAGELSIETAYPQTDGTLAPAFLIRIPASKCQVVMKKAKFDVAGHAPGVDPDPLISGTFTLEQEVTHVVG